MLRNSKVGVENLYIFFHSHSICKLTAVKSHINRHPTITSFPAPLPLAETVRTPEEIKACRTVVLNDLLESERAHVAEIRGLLENFLEPLSTGQM